MKTKLILALTACFMLATALLAPLGVGAMGIIGGTAVIGGLSYITPNYGLNAGLNKEVWLAEIMEGFYADDMFVSEARDLSAFVENNTINLAEAGVNPEVLINNTSYPIPIAQREDTPLALPLDTLDTENTLVQSIETAELSYDKRASVEYGHRQALRMKVMERAAFRWAPASNGEFTPIITCTGEANEEGRRRLKFKDIRRLKRKFNNAEIPAEGRILVLSAQHMEDLENENLTLYNQLLNTNNLYGFKVYELAEKRLPRYNHSTGAKIAWGAAAQATDTHASIAFHKDEVMRCDGTVDMFVREKDPELRGDVLGFQQRNLTMPFRNKGIAAIYSPVVPVPEEE